jgi:hypothetical protein
MGYDPNHHHQRIGPAHVPGTQKRPKLYRARLEEVSHKQIQAVPGCRYEDPQCQNLMDCFVKLKREWPHRSVLGTGAARGAVEQKLLKARELKGRARLQLEWTHLSTENEQPVFVSCNFLRRVGPRVSEAFQSLFPKTTGVHKNNGGTFTIGFGPADYRRIRNSCPECGHLLNVK